MKYTYGKHLGSGAFGIVREATKKSEKDGQIYAIKTVWKSSIPDPEFLRKEIEILLSLEHKHIIKCYEVYEDITCVHFVFELIAGGELFDFIINSAKGRLDEKVAMEVFVQMIDAIHYMHSEGFVHRDIKPENFLISTNEGKYDIKLIDFGFATDFKEGEGLVSKVGSINYIAPEMLYDEGTYDNKVDIWAIGICLYNMIAGKQPFADDDPEKLTEKIRNNEVKFNSPVFDTINFKIKKLIEKLLDKNPKTRLSAGEIKINPWIGQFTGADDLPTHVEEFDLKKKSKNIKTILNIHKNMKPEFWEFCMKNLKNDISKEIYVSTLFNTICLLLFSMYHRMNIKEKINKMIYSFKIN